jgi:hypothetical protein
MYLGWTSSVREDRLDVSLRSWYPVCQETAPRHFQGSAVDLVCCSEECYGCPVFLNSLKMKSVSTLGQSRRSEVD